MSTESKETGKKDQAVCVTGGTGYLGSWCVALLLERGCTVHMTCRSSKKASYLKGLPGAEERLRIFEGCDLLKEGSFDEAIKGCDAVLHTASPFYFQGGSEEKLVRPAVLGTENVFRSCNRANVKRVALTSSTASVYANYGTKEADYVWTSADWSSKELLREKKNWYSLSKVTAEERAWKMAKEPGCTFKLTVLNPTLIWGPQLKGQPHMNTSCQALMGYIDGTKKYIDNATKAVVDVRDVALAHILAVESDNGVGQRFLLIAESPHFSEVVKYIREALPAEMKDNVPTAPSSKLAPCSIGAPAPFPTLFDSSPATKILGLQFRSAKEQTIAMIQSCIENGFVSTKQYDTKAMM